LLVKVFGPSDHQMQVKEHLESPEEPNRGRQQQMDGGTSRGSGVFHEITSSQKAHTKRQQRETPRRRNAAVEGEWPCKGKQRRQGARHSNQTTTLENR